MIEESNRGEIANSSLSGSGSDQTRSAIGPSCGISGRSERSAFILWALRPHERASKSVDYLDLIYSMHRR